MKTRLALLAVAATLAAAPAFADEGAAASKSSAILGGKSRLAAIMAEQSGLAPAAEESSSPVLPGIADRAERLVPVSANRPDVFGSVSIPLKSSPLDARWAAVSGDQVSGAAAGYAARLADRGDVEKLEAINRYVNGHVRFIDDSRAFGTPDRWTRAAETFATGRGDCEDYALAKMAMARRAGFADRDLYLVVLKDLARRADHAVLVVRAEGRFLVLDNGTDDLIDSDRMRDYRPILTFTRGQRFTHGYRTDRAERPVIMAAAGRIQTPARPAPTVTLAMAERRSLPVSIFAAPVPASAPFRR